MPFHAGEIEIQRRAGTLDDAVAVGRGIATVIGLGAARFLSRQRLAVAATIDSSGRVWASPLFGAPGFLHAVDPELLRIALPTAVPGDPMVKNLQDQPQFGLLVLDPSTRQRMRFNGRAVAADEAIFVRVNEVYGNCPKYIQRRRLLTDAVIDPAESTTRREPTDAQRERIARADTFFIATVNPEGGADASHRGGRPGFVRFEDPRTIAFADYPGNGMFNSLGNLALNPRAGLLFLDFENGDVIQMTGIARVDDDLRVRLAIDEIREARAASPLRYEFVEFSPANPALGEFATSLSHGKPSGI